MPSTRHTALCTEGECFKKHSCQRISHWRIQPKSPKNHITRPYHHTDNPAATNASTAPSNASKEEISVSFFSTVSRELSVSYTFFKSAAVAA